MNLSEVKHLPKVDHTPAKVEKMSEAIRLGHFMIRDAKHWLYEGCGCALVAGVVGAGHSPNSDLPVAKEVYEKCHALFPDVPLAVLERVSVMHHMEDKTRLELADWLESQGY